MHNGSNRLGEVFFALCKSLDTPVSLGYWLRYKHSQESLASDSIPCSQYDDLERFRRDYAVSEFLSKYKGLETGIDTKAVALSKFILAEEKNSLTNRRIRNSRSKSIDFDVASCLHTTRRIIAKILGSFNRQKILDHPRWSPGSTSTIKRFRARVDTKMLTIPLSTTQRCLPYIREEIGNDLHWSAAILGYFPEGPFCFTKDVFQVVDGNKVVTVPKNAKTDRVIASEPTANIFLQKSIGHYIRKRLRSHGVDLDDQTVNQRMAASAYAFDYATLDLRSASDTISLELVFDLLPVDWALLLYDLRSDKGVLPDGTVVTYEKFSSMGNGYTFELESLIFFALSKSVLDHLDSPCPPFVYGDDIILPSDAVALLTKVFDFVGFEVNPEKSHVSSPFRESCGKHFFRGHDVTPAYQKEIPIDLLGWIRLGNRLIRNLNQLPYRQAWLAARRFGGGSEFTLPYGADGDDGWVVPLDEFRPTRSCRNRGFECRVIRSHFKRVRVDEGAFYAYELRKKSESTLTGPQNDSNRFDGTALTDRVLRLGRSRRWVHVLNVCPLDSRP